MSILDLRKREFGKSENAAVAEVAANIASARKNPRLAIYEGAVAIDGADTKDRDDAVNLTEDAHHIKVETFIADPTRFIERGHPIDIAAKERLYTLYHRHGRSPMLPFTLSEGELSLDAGKLSPAVRIAASIDKQSGAITSVAYEKCWLKAENMSYEQVAKKIEEGDERLALWSQKAKWLRDRRQTDAKGEILPTYDAESGIYRKEDGQISYVDPKVINSHNIVQEAMILTNHAIGLLTQSCFDFGVYRGQLDPTSKSEYMDIPVKHASLGITPYTHGTSPIRRYPDILVHRLLSALGDKFELQVDKPPSHTFPPPCDRAEQQVILDELNKYGVQLKDYYKRKREEDALDWLEKHFPEANPQKFKSYKPDEFSDRLKIAAARGIMSDAYADEIKSRLDHKGTYALVMPRDAVSILRHISRKNNRENPLWIEIAEKVIERLARDPYKLEKVFDSVIDKVGFQDAYVKKSSFFTRPSQEPEERRNYSVAAAAVVATMGGRHYTSSKFYLSPSHSMAELRAKLEFLSDYATGKLKASDNPKFPEGDKSYVIEGLHFEQANEIRDHLINAGYELKEKAEQVEPANAALPKEYQYTLELSRGGKLEFDVTVTGEELEETKKIGLEVASQQLSSRLGHNFNNGESAHPGAASFATRFPKRSTHGDFKKIIAEQRMVLPHPRTAIVSKGACEALDDILKSQGYVARAFGAYKTKKDLKITIGSSKDQHLEAILDHIAELLPNAALITRPGTSVIIENAPPLLLQLCEQRRKEQQAERRQRTNIISKEEQSPEDGRSGGQSR